MMGSYDLFQFSGCVRGVGRWYVRTFSRSL
jgi:hypothetical protein